MEDRTTKSDATLLKEESMNGHGPVECPPKAVPSYRVTEGSSKKP